MSDGVATSGTYWLLVSVLFGNKLVAKSNESFPGAGCGSEVCMHRPFGRLKWMGEGYNDTSTNQNRMQMVVDLVE